MTCPATNISGWMSVKELSWLYDRAKEMTSIVEIGSWQGRSTHALLSGCPGHVVAVDNWDAELMEPYGDALAARQSFFKNVQGFKNLTVMEMDSVKASAAFRDRSVEMVFIDGNHSYEAVKADIQAWLPKVKKLICGHDYAPRWPGVIQAVNEIFGADFQVYEAIWYVEIRS